MDKKMIGGLHLLAGLIAGWFGWQNGDWGVLTIAIFLIIISFHHFKE